VKKLLVSTIVLCGLALAGTASAATIYCTGGPCYGTSGLDIIYGTTGPDQIYGYDGNDRIYGYQGGDTLYGGPGDDGIYGGDSGDDLLGGTGADDLWGQAGSDALHGNDGNDELEGGAGQDYHYGMGHNDVVRLCVGEPYYQHDFWAEGGGGTDSVNLNSGEASFGGYFESVSYCSQANPPV
jgi:Ca2+-binding RTX toxin-like protein